MKVLQSDLSKKVQALIMDFEIPLLKWGFVKKHQKPVGNIWKDKTRYVTKTTYHQEFNQEHPNNLRPK